MVSYPIYCGLFLFLCLHTCDFKGDPEIPSKTPQNRFS